MSDVPADASMAVIGEPGVNSNAHVDVDYNRLSVSVKAEPMRVQNIK
jgi:hypothetical protein